jgi:hypothetical protein
MYCGPYSVGVLHYVSDQIQNIQNCFTTPNKNDHAVKTTLKVLTNEKRGGLKVVAFDRSPFKLFSLKFSTKSVQTPSCERHKTAPRTLFQTIIDSQ